jgi:glycosyltransferase involved in cell wall biosynthesis
MSLPSAGTDGTTVDSILFLRSTPVKNDARASNLVFIMTSPLGVTVVEWCRTSSKMCKSRHQNNIVFHKKAKYGMGLGGLLPQIFWQTFLLKTIRSLPHKVIYACDLDTALVALIAKPKSCKLVFDEFDSISSRQKWIKVIFHLLSKLEGIARKRCDLNIVPSPNRISETSQNVMLLENLWSTSKSNTHIPNHLSPIPTASYFGTLQEDRGIHAIIELARIRPDWKFKIAGQGELADFLNGISLPNVQFLGSYEWSELFQVFRDSWINFALYNPALSNNVKTASNKLVESSSLLIPVITNSGTNIGDIVLNYSLGWNVEYDNIEEMSKALDERLIMSGASLDNLRHNLSVYNSILYQRHRDQISDFCCKLESYCY